VPGSTGSNRAPIIGQPVRGGKRRKPNGTRFLRGDTRVAPPNQIRELIVLTFGDAKMVVPGPRRIDSLKRRTYRSPIRGNELALTSLRAPAHIAMQRRDFLFALLAGIGAAPAARSAGKKRRTVRYARPAPSPLDRVCVSSKSFNSYFEVVPDGGVTSPSERLVLLDFARMVADRYKIHNLEFAASQFASLDPVYEQALRTNLAAARSRLINIAVDVKEVAASGGLSDPAAEVRTAAVEAVTPWIDMAHRLRAQSVSCDPGRLNPDDTSPAIDSFRKLANHGRRRKIIVLIENRGEAGAAHPAALVAIIRAVGGPFVGALPDFSGFPDNATRLRSLPMPFGYAHTICHAKQPQANTPNGQPDFDFQRCLDISKAANFHGVYCVEYDGENDAYARVQNAADELIRYL
jgi:Xylose isomerase-like TIM barrel